jgi:hypothetical protein
MEHFRTLLQSKISDEADAMALQRKKYVISKLDGVK